MYDHVWELENVNVDIKVNGSPLRQFRRPKIGLLDRDEAESFSTFLDLPSRMHFRDSQ